MFVCLGAVLCRQLWCAGLECIVCPWSSLWPWTDDRQIVGQLFAVVCLSAAIHCELSLSAMFSKWPQTWKSLEITRGIFGTWKTSGKLVLLLGNSVQSRGKIVTNTIVSPDANSGVHKCFKCVYGWASVPDQTGATCSASPDNHYYN